VHRPEHCTAQQAGRYNCFVYQLQPSEYFGSLRTGQLILAEVKARQLRELPNLGRDRTCQRIVSHKATNCVDAHLVS
jgi:hypothetical protein